MVLDVVYNHMGPSGAYLDRFGPYFGGDTVWGPTVNLDGAHSEDVRRYVVETLVEKQVTLVRERVVVERRRPVTNEVSGEALAEP